MPTSYPLLEPDDALPLIRASELAQFSFCQRAWWLNTIKQIPPNNQAVLKHGTQIHRLHTRQVHSALRWRQASFFLLAGGGLLLGMTLLLYFLQ
ncbi:MAG: hypothetical protein DPW09_27090 [Anaerolineae bacterium]|nr:hypothetical protein [Anaerolineales bacterium]MCQ3977112.1 hypothetical protein [Anaerolineae bacterium]